MTDSSDNRIQRIFAELKSQNTQALMPFVVGGYPTPELLLDMLKAVDSAGASIIEIGFPFSDPVADGPVIAAAMHTALSLGANSTNILAGIESCRDNVDAGLVAMISASLVHRLGGPDRFAQLASLAGLDGCIFPDVPLEEAQPYVEGCQNHGLCVSLLVAPTTPIERAAKIAELCSGFVYVLARAGITGESSGVPAVAARINQLRSVTDLPLAVGFGISTAEHIQTVTESADAAIVGSALVRKISDALEAGTDPVEAARSFVFTLAQGIS